MRTAVIYPFPQDDRTTFEPFAKRYIASYLQFRASADHDFIVVFCCGKPQLEDVELFEALHPARMLSYDGGGIDIGCALHTAKLLEGQYDFMVASTSRVYFHRPGWLKRLVDARLKYGPGLYGATGSYEGWEPKPAPNPHMRTVLYGMDVQLFTKFPHAVVDRPTAHQFESGRWNYANWIRRAGLPVKMVTWDGEYDREHWRCPANIFRRGNQSNILCFDKHSDEYHQASNEQKKRLTRLADGDIANFPNPPTP